jgi:hypothetical protein
MKIVGILLLDPHIHTNSSTEKATSNEQRLEKENQAKQHKRESKKKEVAESQKQTEQYRLRLEERKKEYDQSEKKVNQSGLLATCVRLKPRLLMFHRHLDRLGRDGHFNYHQDCQYNIFSLSNVGGTFVGP